MKKNILIVLIMLISAFGFAQEIKIKKGQVLLGGKPIANIESKVRNYKISNLDGNTSIMAYTRVGNPYAFIELKNEVVGRSNDMDFVKYSPFNIDRSIVQTLFSKGLMTENGIDIEKVNAFLNGEPTGLAEKYGYIRPEVLAAEAEIANSYQLTIDDNGTIFSRKVMIEKQAQTVNRIPTGSQMDDLSKGIIGYIKVTSPSTNGELKYEVIDLDGYLIATWFAKSGTYSGYGKFLNQELITADRKIFKADFDNRGNPIGYKMSKDITAMNIVRALMANGYTLGTKYPEKR
jgi:hypothetical protein